MSNRLGYRCPRCQSIDYIVIAAIIEVRLTDTGTIGDASMLGPDDWCSESTAGCDACGFEGCVKDFEPSATDVVVDLATHFQQGRR